MNQHVQSRTASNLGQEFSAVQGRGIHVSFQWDMVKLTSTNPEKKGQRQRRLRLIKQPVGDSATTAAGYISPELAAQKYPVEWDHFTKHGEMPLVGTALSELPNISVSQIQLMQLSGLRSIEDVLSVAPEVINGIGFEARYVRSVAEEWKKRADGSRELTDYAERKASTDAALAAAQARAARAEEAMRSMQAQIDAMSKMLGSGAANLVPTSPNGDGIGRYDEGPDIESTYNPLAEGTGDMGDDPLDD